MKSELNNMFRSQKFTSSLKGFPSKVSKNDIKNSVSE